MFSNIEKRGEYEFIFINGSRWLKVFLHNHSTKQNFADETEALHTKSEFKYSILDEINSNMLVNGKYEFIMDFPNDIFIHWRQNKNPFHELDDKIKLTASK